MDLNYTVAINPNPGLGELTVLFSGYSQTSRDHRVGPLVHDYCLIHCVLSGRGTFHCHGQAYPAGKGDIFVIFPGELVRYDAEPDDPWEYRWVALRGHQLDELLGRLGLSPRRPVIRGARGDRTAVRFRRVERILRAGGPACDLEAEGWVRLILASLAEKRAEPAHRESGGTSETRRQVEQAVRWLTLQHAQPISIERLARHLGYHRTHLSKIFKQHTGISPMGYLLEIRLNRAKLLLAEDLTVEQVAASVGYADPLYFSKLFKKHTGLSPTAYRRQAEEESS